MGLIVWQSFWFSVPFMKIVASVLPWFTIKLMKHTYLRNIFSNKTPSSSPREFIIAVFRIQLVLIFFFFI